jgi:ABC-2 type transport system ATP-binding protein
MSLRAERITKHFKGFQLGPVSFECGDHSILGLVGKNGAGKTTLLRSIFGLYRQTEATVLLDGQPYDAESNSSRQRIVYQPEATSVPLFLNARSLGELLKRFYAKWSAEEYARLLSTFGVPSEKKIRSLSTGNRRKLAIAAALAAQPDVALLDEPTSNVDPISRDDILSELLRYRSRHPAAILLSSHILSDVRRVADKILVLNNGSVTYYGALPTLDSDRESEDQILQYMR